MSSHFSEFSSQGFDDEPVNLSYRSKDPLKNKRGRPRIEFPVGTSQGVMNGRMDKVTYLLAQGHQPHLVVTWKQPDQKILGSVDLGVATADTLCVVVNNSIIVAQERFDGSVNSLEHDCRIAKDREAEEAREASKRFREREHYLKLGQVFNMLRRVIRVSSLVFTARKGAFTARDSCVLSCFTARKLQCVNRVSFLIFRQKKTTTTNKLTMVVCVLLFFSAEK
jgi:hypothetical protein